MATQVSDWAKALVEGIHKFWDHQSSQYKEQWSKLFDVMPSRKHFEEEVATSGLGLATVRAPGEPVTMDQDRQFFRTIYKHVEYGLGIAIPSILIRDDLYDVAAARKTAALHRSAMLTREVVCHNIINRATDANYPMGDGVSLLSTAHLYADGNTYANKPTVDVGLSAVALEDAFLALTNFRDNANQVAPTSAVSLHLPPALYLRGLRIYNTPMGLGTAHGDINPVNHIGLFPGGIHMHHFITDTGRWIIKTDAPDGFKLFERDPVRLSQTDEWDTDVIKMKVLFRMVPGVTNPRSVYGSTG